MTYQPIVGNGGLAGWRLLQATTEKQRAAFERSPTVTRDAAYFQENASKVSSAEDLVKDRRLLSVALGAYGLGDELEKQAYIREILEGGTEERLSFANRVADPRFRALANAFDFGNTGGVAGLKGGEFASALADRYEDATGETLDISEREYISDALDAAANLDALIEDPRAFPILQGGFGLDAEFDKTAFVHRLLDQGVDTADTLANSLDQRVQGTPYRQFVEFFDGYSRADILTDPASLSGALIDRIETTTGDELADVDRIYLQRAVENISTPEQLLEDPRVLELALTAFGLEDELTYTTFLNQVASEGIDDPDALANQLENPGYVEFASFFNFNNQGGGAGLQSETFRDAIVSRYKELEFERAVGEVDNDMRLAMNFAREIQDIAETSSDDSSSWLRILGQPALREVVTTAFGLPTEASQIDVDLQAEILADRAEQFFGGSTPAIFQDEENVDALIRRFFVFRDLASGPTALTAGAGALGVLQAGSIGGIGGANLVLSQA